MLSSLTRVWNYNLPKKYHTGQVTCVNTSNSSRESSRSLLLNSSLIKTSKFKQHSVSSNAYYWFLYYFPLLFLNYYDAVAPIWICDIGYHRDMQWHFRAAVLHIQEKNMWVSFSNNPQTIKTLKQNFNKTTQTPTNWHHCCSLA